jgi:holo-[acyl-carrier protein] synthase
MVGIDIVDIDRFERAMERFGDRLLKRLFTESEMIYCASKRRPSAHFAARFAAKECVIKILGRAGFWRHGKIEIVSGQEGRPTIELYGLPRAAGEELRFEVSISHDGNVAAAVVTAETLRKEGGD